MSSTTKKDATKSVSNAATSAKTATPVATVPVNNITSKRFFIRKKLIGTNTVVTFINHKKETCVYNHDKVYNQLKAKFDLMPCFEKYGIYTNTNNLPAFVRALPEIV